MPQGAPPASSTQAQSRRRTRKRKVEDVRDILGLLELLLDVLPHTEQARFGSLESLSGRHKEPKVRLFTCTSSRFKGRCLTRVPLRSGSLWRLTA